MKNQLEQLRESLLRGIATSKQQSYSRRAPTQESRPLLENARDALVSFLKDHPTNIEAWRLLSQAHECLLNYRESIACLKQAIDLGGAIVSKKDLKRLALLRQSLAEWDALPMSPFELQKLGEFLEDSGADDQSRGRTFELTAKWLKQSGFESPDRVIDALKNRGAMSDFQVLRNVVRG